MRGEGGWVTGWWVRMEKVISGIDRARRARSETSLGIVLDAAEANPFVFFNNFHVFSVFFCSFFDFRWVSGGGGIFGIDRAHQVLLGTSETRVGTHMQANPFRKKSNPCLRYPT